MFKNIILGFVLSAFGSVGLCQTIVGHYKDGEDLKITFLIDSCPVQNSYSFLALGKTDKGVTSLCWSHSNFDEVKLHFYRTNVRLLAPKHIIEWEPLYLNFLFNLEKLR